MFRNGLMVLISALSLVVFTACSDNDDIPKASVAVLHASPDAPKVDIKVNDDTVLEGVDFAIGSGLLALNSDTYTIAVDGILPGDKRTTVIGPVALDFDGNTRYVIIAANNVLNIEPIVVTAPFTKVDSDQVRVQVVHATATAPEVDVYVTAPDADINDTSPLGTFGYKANLGPVEVPSGDYRIRVAPKGTKNVLFDSGSVPLEGGNDLVITAVANTKIGEGYAPIQLVVLDGTTSFVISDKDTPASVRVIHDSPDAPAVDIIVNNNFNEPLVEDFAYTDFTPYVNVASGTYNIKVAVADTQNAVIDANLTFEKGSMQSVYAVNEVSKIEPLILNDDNRSVATEAKVRLVHGSPTAGSVDIYVTAPDANISSVAPAFSGVQFKEETGYVSLDEGDYRVRVTPTGSKDAVIDTDTISFNAGGVYTAIARDATDTETELFGLILLDDFNKN